MINSNHCPSLVLNADYRPLSYFPLSIWSWKDTVKAVFLDRVNIVEEYDQKVSSPSFEIKLPSILHSKITYHIVINLHLQDLMFF